jgi:hypothetical protein
MFDRMIWMNDRMLFNDLVFRLEYFRSDEWDGGDNYLSLYKTKELVEQYRLFFSHYPNFHPHQVFELGIFDGGSTVFWYELFKPNKFVAIDILDRTDSPYFRRYVESHGLRQQIKTYWKTDQNDKKKLRSICTSEFTGNLDLVIDDASHMYEPTRSSFEALFPLCKPGGLYIIEDWAWGHWPDFIKPDHPWANCEVLTRLVTELVESAGTSPLLISNMVVYQGFVVIERGPLQFENSRDFNLEQHIVRRSR